MLAPLPAAGRTWTTRSSAWAFTPRPLPPASMTASSAMPALVVASRSIQENAPPTPTELEELPPLDEEPPVSLLSTPAPVITPVCDRALTSMAWSYCQSVPSEPATSGADQVSGVPSPSPRAVTLAPSPIHASEVWSTPK